MVASARLAAGLSGLRNRNTRVTNKTQLRVVRGSIEADPIILDDDDEKNRILASQGVDEEDANEHHLQAALFASSQRSLSTTQIKPSTGNDSNAFIPTPDAAGLVAEYDALYPPGRFKDPVTHLRFSDSIEESCDAGLAGAYTYFLDERDAEWLERNNSAARGEGTSTSGSVHSRNGTIDTSSSQTRGGFRMPHGRNGRGKGKGPEQCPPTSHQPSMIVDEDHFELIMGLFEKWTDDPISPYLHLDPDPQHFPNFVDYEKFFSMPLHPSMFANFVIPPGVPGPEQMVQLANTIYPWWKERRMEREGHRIVPQLHVLVIEAQEKEDKTGGSPYVCFRKRDVKPMRKTRTNNVTHTEKLTRLHGELQASLELAQMVLQREKLKEQSAAAAEDVWHSRELLAGYMKQLNGTAPGSVPPGDESLLFDKERKSRKPKIETTPSGRIILAANRRPSNARGGLSDLLDPHSPLTLNGDTSHAFEQCQGWPTARATGIQREVDRDLAKARKDDAYWEDLVDMPYQPMLASNAERFFKPLSSLSDSGTAVSSSPTFKPVIPDEEEALSQASRVARSIRLRTGRGGRMHLDRRLHIPKPHRLLQREWAGYPPRAKDGATVHEEAERWAARSWRPRRNSDFDVRLGRRERTLGEEYWAHPSLHDREADAGMKRVEPQQQQDENYPTIGFEQSGYGWDGHGHGYSTRELWLRARTGRDEEGWKPTPFLAVNSENQGIEVAARNAAERERLIEAWRGRMGDGSSGSSGGALALFTDGGSTDENGVHVQAAREEDLDAEMDKWGSGEPSTDSLERAWRLDERWRYDSEAAGLYGQDAEDRFLLDDYQAKFLRTTITLLDAEDHEAIKTDPQLLTPQPPKQNRYLDHQLRLQHSGLPRPSVTPAMTPNPQPPRQTPIPSHPLSSPSQPNNNGVPTQLPAPPRSPPRSVASYRNGSVNGSVIGPTDNSTPSARSLSPPKPNGTNTLGLVPGGARIPPDSAATVRVSTPVRTKLPPTGASLGLPNAGATNGNGDASSNLPFTPHDVQPYPSLKRALGRVVAAHLDPSAQQPGRLYQASIPNGSDPPSMNLSSGNFHLKLPPQRVVQARVNGTGEHHGDNVAASEPQAADHYTHAQQLAIPRLPPASTRTA